jgi:hypothetical protein
MDQRNVNLIILVSGIDCQGPNGARNALLLGMNFVAVTGVDIFVEEFVAFNQSLAECMSYSKSLTIAIP